MYIFHVAAECVPLVKVGGLADVVGALPKSLRQPGAEVSVIIPCYGHLYAHIRDASPVFTSGITFGNDNLPVEVFHLNDSSVGFNVYLVHEPSHFGQNGIYQDAGTGLDFENQGDRFAVFQLGALAFLSSRQVDVLHLHDHHTGLIPYLVRHTGGYESLQDAVLVYTVHSAEHQGRYPAEFWRKFGFAEELPDAVVYRGEVNSMKAGIVAADAVTTVSPGYAAELVESEDLSSGLHSVFRSAASKLHGILNGIDHEVWHPSRDPMIPHNYSVDDLSGKDACKRVLCEEFGLDPALPLFSFIGRLMDEKGMQILPDAVAGLLGSGEPANVFILGTGHPRYERQLTRLAETHRHNGKINASLVLRLEFNEMLAHRLYASSDFLLMPSRVEPCGLNQLYALTYGTIPIVHAVGGLRDTVKEWSPVTRRGNGFVFDSFTPDAFLEAIRRGFHLYRRSGDLSALRRNAMETDWSWNASAKRYMDLYASLLTGKPITYHPKP